MLKNKKCQGTGITAGYGCGDMIPVALYGRSNRTYGLGHECGCYKEWLFESEEGQKKLERMKISPVSATNLKPESEDSEKDQNWAKKLQDKINEIVKIIDKDKKPFGSIQSEEVHAGHVYSRGAESHLKYHTHNIHSQYGLSNTAQNEDQYLRSELMEMYGLDYLEYLNGLRAMDCLNYSKVEYEAFYRKACKIANRLKKENCVYRKTDRIRMRNNINLELNIYPFQHCQFSTDKINSYASIN